MTSRLQAILSFYIVFAGLVCVLLGMRLMNHPDLLHLLAFWAAVLSEGFAMGWYWRASE